MATKIISQQKVSDLSHMMVKHLNDKLESLKDQVRLKIEESLKPNYPKEILEFAEKYPEFLKSCESISIYWSVDNLKDYKFTVYPKLPKYPVDFNLSNLFTSIDPNKGLRRDVIATLMDEYCQVEKKKNELRNKIKCTLNTLKTYARIKNEFPEAYKLLVEKIDKEVLNVDDPCTDVEALRAELTAK